MQKTMMSDWRSPTDWDLYSSSETRITSFGFKMEFPKTINLPVNRLLIVALSPSVSENIVHLKLDQPLTEYFPLSGYIENDEENIKKSGPGIGAGISADFKITKTFWIHTAAGSDLIFINDARFKDKLITLFHLNAGICIKLGGNKIYY